MDEARLTQVQLLYDLQDQLSFRTKPHPQQSFIHSDCMFHVPCIDPIAILYANISVTSIDPTCILLPPRTATPPEPSLFKKIIAALATRYNTSATHIQCICSAECVKTWGKVRRLDGGDTMHAAGVVKPAQDSRDATFIRVWIHCLFFSAKLIHDGAVRDLSGQVCMAEEMTARI